MQYTQEDKEVIEEFLKAKRSWSKSDTLVEREDLIGNSGHLHSLSSLYAIIIAHVEKSLLTFTKHLNHEQLFLWLCDHPGFMGVDYRHDIGKLKGSYMSL
jgi:hypothetical protein